MANISATPAPRAAPSAPEAHATRAALLLSTESTAVASLAIASASTACASVVAGYEEDEGEGKGGRPLMSPEIEPRWRRPLLLLFPSRAKAAAATVSKDPSDRSENGEMRPSLPLLLL